MRWIADAWVAVASSQLEGESADALELTESPAEPRVIVAGEVAVGKDDGALGAVARELGLARRRLVRVGVVERELDRGAAETIAGDGAKVRDPEVRPGSKDALDEGKHENGREQHACCG